MGTVPRWSAKARWVGGMAGVESWRDSGIWIPDGELCSTERRGAEGNERRQEQRKDAESG